jgi:hypothetical protein
MTSSWRTRIYRRVPIASAYFLTQRPPRLFVTDAYVHAQLRPNRRKSNAHLVAKLDQLQLHGG